jgi:steroid delta-isomerase-like uncharacterized protein
VSAEENKAVIRQWIEAYNERDLEAEADVLAPGIVVHVPAAPGPLEGLEAWRRFSGSFAEAFPDLRLTVQDIAAEGDTVAARVDFHGTHRGEFQGIPPTGKEVDFSSVEGLFSEVRVQWQITPLGDAPPSAHPVGCPLTGPLCSSLGARSYAPRTPRRPASGYPSDNIPAKVLRPLAGCTSGPGRFLGVVESGTTFMKTSGRRVAMDIDVIEKAIKASLAEALKRTRQAEEELKKAEQGGRSVGNPKLAEALEEYTRCVDELTYYLKASGRNRDTNT